MRSKTLMASAFALAAVFATTTAAPSWAAPPIPCTGAIGAVEINGNISAGAGCDLSGATVKGDVTVNPGGSLTTKEGSTTVITGNVQSSNATEIFLVGATSVGGDVRLTGTMKSNFVAFGNVNGNVEVGEGIAESFVFEESVGGNVQLLNTSFPLAMRRLGEVQVDLSIVGGNIELGNNSLNSIDENTVVVEGTLVAGNLRVYNNSATLELQPGGRENENRLLVLSNLVGGNVELLNNTGFSNNRSTELLFGAEIAVVGNTVRNNLICTGNQPQPTRRLEENTAKHKLGQCELL